MKYECLTLLRTPNISNFWFSLITRLDLNRSYGLMMDFVPRLYPTQLKYNSTFSLQRYYYGTRISRLTILLFLIFIIFSFTASI